MTNCELRVGARQKGFTLIEMSIVLVIIGLIIGGILKGQEIIESSRQKNFVTQLNAIRASITTFQDRYRALPGDYALATSRISSGGALANGNGNGTIGASATTVSNIVDFSTANQNESENLLFWVHLKAARLIEGVAGSSTAGTAFGEDSPMPSTAFPSAGLTLNHGTYDAGTDNRTSHWLVLHRQIGSAGAALTGRQMFAIDTRTDDGFAGRGTFRSTGSGTGCGTATATAPDYSATSDTVACVALIDMLP